MKKPEQHLKPKDIELTKDIIEEKISRDKIRRYKKGKLLGIGGFARCYEFICQDNNKLFAAKVINKINLSTAKQKQKLMAEIKIHKSLHHNQIVAFEHNFEDEENVYILLEVCKNQTLSELSKRRKKLTEIEVQCYIIQLIKGLQYLRSHKIIHRDLKLGNLFLTDKMELKLGDFGLATKLDYDGEKRRTNCGTPNYIAPEIVEKVGHSYEVDIWAIGIIIYALLIGKPPFETSDIKTTNKRIKAVEYYYPKDCHISCPAVKLIQRILVKDPKLRPSLEEILMDDFFNLGFAIPKLLPSATLATAPNLDYIRRFIPNCDKFGISPLHEKEKNEIMKKFINENEKNDENSTKEGSEKVKTEDEIKNNEIIEQKNDEKKINEKKGPQIYVIKWVDYSSKYGLGYLMSNNIIGVYFNDCTKMMWNPKSNKLHYIEKQISGEKEMHYTFDLNQVPQESQKKALIFQNFKKYFEEEVKYEKEKAEKENEEKKKSELVMCKTSKKKNIKDLSDDNIEEDNTKEENIFVRKWMKTKQAIFFRLSNKAIQVIFKDRTEIIICNDTISYKGKSKEMNVYKIDDALNSSNYEMNKRIKYTQNILNKIISVNKGNNKE